MLAEVMLRAEVRIPVQEQAGNDDRAYLGLRGRRNESHEAPKTQSRNADSIRVNALHTLKHMEGHARIVDGETRVDITRSPHVSRVLIVTLTFDLERTEGANVGREHDKASGGEMDAEGTVIGVPHSGQFFGSAIVPVDQENRRVWPGRGGAQQERAGHRAIPNPVAQRVFVKVGGRDDRARDRDLWIERSGRFEQLSKQQEPRAPFVGLIGLVGLVVAGQDLSVRGSRNRNRRIGRARDTNGENLTDERDRTQESEPNRGRARTPGRTLSYARIRHAGTCLTTRTDDVKEKVGRSTSSASRARAVAGNPAAT